MTSSSNSSSTNGGNYIGVPGVGACVMPTTGPPPPMLPEKPGSSGSGSESNLKYIERGAPEGAAASVLQTDSKAAQHQHAAAATQALQQGSVALAATVAGINSNNNNSNHSHNNNNASNVFYAMNV